jgi:hypothetical protein
MERPPGALTLGESDRRVPAVWAAACAGLAAPDDLAAVADEARWQLGRASPAVRDALRRLPPPTRPAACSER